MLIWNFNFHCQSRDKFQINNIHYIRDVTVKYMKFVKFNFFFFIKFIELVEFGKKLLDEKKNKNFTNKYVKFRQLYSIISASRHFAVFVYISFLFLSFPILHSLSDCNAAILLQSGAHSSAYTFRASSFKVNMKNA